MLCLRMSEGKQANLNNLNNTVVLRLSRQEPLLEFKIGHDGFVPSNFEFIEHT